jgi:hypothetical protein
MVEQVHHQLFLDQMLHMLAEVVEVVELTQLKQEVEMVVQEEEVTQDFLQIDQQITWVSQEQLIVAEVVAHDLQILMKFPHHLLHCRIKMVLLEALV